MKLAIHFLLALLFVPQLCCAQEQPSLNNQTIDGYKGIWFALGQVSRYGDKYSGGLGTYTAHHSPLAIYAPEVNKTFFVYGGTTHEKERHLLCMIGSFDHRKKTVSRPVVVFDKIDVDDPHDNPSLMIDDKGYLWVFVSGRSTSRNGFKYRSVNPYDISAFEQVAEEIMTYPQPLFIKGKGYFNFFTKYTGVRELYFETSQDGKTWTNDVKLAGMRKPTYEKSGHYQVSNYSDNAVFTFFNWHPDGDVDKRTNIYFVQTHNFGKSFETAPGETLKLPLEVIASSAMVMDYEPHKKNVYLCDAVADASGNPVCLYITSDGHEPGPGSGVREWHVLFRRDQQWFDRTITDSDHNYDMGSLFIDGKVWRLIAPTDPGPQVYGAGGDVVIWESIDQGLTWKRKKQLTAHSERNHNYVRRVVNGKSPFLYFWADGNPNQFSASHLYFGDSKGNVYKLPYDMQGDQQALHKLH